MIHSEPTLRSVQNWINNEIVHPILDLYRWSKKHWKSCIVLSLVAQICLFLVFPSLWIQPQLKTQIIAQPHLTLTGRNNHLKIERSPESLRYSLVNYSYSSLAVQNLCQAMQNNTAPAIQQLTVYTLERPYLNYATKRQDAFIADMLPLNASMTSDHITISNDQDLERWLRYQNRPLQVLRFFSVLNFIYIIILFGISLQRKTQ